MSTLSPALDVQIKDPDTVAGLLAKAFQRAMSDISVGLAVNFERQTIEADIDAGAPALHEHLKALISEHYRFNAQSVSIDSAGVDDQGVPIPILNVVFIPLEVPRTVPTAPSPATDQAVASEKRPVPPAKPAPIGQRAPVQAPTAVPVSVSLPEPAAPVSNYEVLGPAPFTTGNVPPPANPREILPRRRSTPRPEAMDARLAVAEQLQEEAARGARGINYLAEEDDDIPRVTRHPIKDLRNVPTPPILVDPPRYPAAIPSQPQVVVDRGGSLF